MLKISSVGCIGLLISIWAQIAHEHRDRGVLFFCRAGFTRKHEGLLQSSNSLEKRNVNKWFYIGVFASGVSSTKKMQMQRKKRVPFPKKKTTLKERGVALNLNNPRTRMQTSNADLFCIRCIFLDPKLVASNAQQPQLHRHCKLLQHFSPALPYITLLYNTSLQHSSPTLFPDTLPTLLYNTLLHLTSLSNTSLQHSSPTLLSKTSLQHFSTTLFPNTLPTLLYNTLPQHSPNTSLQHPSPPYFSLQHFSTTLFSNTSVQNFSTTLVYNTRLQHSSPTLLYNTLLQHFSTTLLS